MKQQVFSQYAKEVGKVFNISNEDIFKKTKQRISVDARHLLYYVCSKRPMRITYIQKYMKENGYDINHSSIIHGINQVKERVSEDRDYVSVVKRVEQCIV